MFATNASVLQLWICGVARMGTAVLLAAVATGCVNDTTRISGGTISPPATVAPAPVCAAKPTWWQTYDHQAFSIGSAVLLQSIDGELGLVSQPFKGESQVFSVADGKPVAVAPGGMDTTLDANWQWYLQPGHSQTGESEWQYTLDVFAFGADTPTVRLLVPGGVSETASQMSTYAMSASGERVVALFCQHGEDAGPARLLQWQRSTGATLPTITLDLPCSRYTYPEGSRLVLTANGTAAAVILSGQRHVWWVDLDRQVFRKTAVVPEFSAEEGDWLMRPIVTLALAPNSSEVAVVGHDGLLRRLALPDLTPIGTEHAAQVSAVYQFTYMPNVASPLAYAGSTGALAFVQSGSNIGVLDLNTDLVTSQFSLPLSESALADGWQFQAPLALAFARGDRGVLVSAELGLGLWGCGADTEPAKQK